VVFASAAMRRTDSDNLLAVYDQQIAEIGARGIMMIASAWSIRRGGAGRFGAGTRCTARGTRCTSASPVHIHEARRQTALGV
jgi:hypothetical protein